MIPPASTAAALATDASVVASALAPAPEPRPGIAEKVGTAVRVVDTIARAVADTGLVPGLTGAKKASSSKTTSKKKTSSAGYASTSATRSTTKASTSKKSSGTSSKGGPLAFLSDPALSLEEKLMRLLAVLSADYDRQVQEKMGALAGAIGSSSAPQPAKGTSASSGTASKAKGAGLIGTVAGMAKQFFPAAGVAVDLLKDPAVRGVVSKIGGPVLSAAATALGFPALAPALLRYGPAVIDVAAGVASSVLDEGGAGKPARGASSAGTGAVAAAGAPPSDADRQLALMEIQRLTEKQKEMFQLVSSILRSRHETHAAVIGNVR